MLQFSKVLVLCIHGRLSIWTFALVLSNAESPELSNSHHHGNLPPPNTAATIEA